MYKVTPLLAAALLLVGCSPGNPDIEETGLQPGFTCEADNDGVIQATEMPVATGVTVPYVSNRPGETVQVGVDPEDREGVPTWDFTSGPTDLHADFRLVDPAGAWFSGHFPHADWAASLYMEDTTIYAVYQQAGDQVLMLGMASQDEQPQSEQTLLIYDEPVPVYQFPLQMGSAWSAETSFRDASILGLTNQGVESYDFEVDSSGTLLLEGFSLENTLRLRIDFAGTYAVAVGDNSTSLIQYLYVHECLGELARVISLADETDPQFSTADEFRRLAAY